MKKWSLLLGMMLVTAWTTLVFAGEEKMVGTISAIEIRGNAAEITMLDRKTDAAVALHVRDAATLEKLKDKKIRVGDELRIRFDKGTKVITYVRKTAGC